MTQISRRSLFGAAAAASVLPVAGGLAAFSPIAAAAAAPKKARTIVEIAAMSPVDMARESDVVQTSYEIIRAAAGRLRDPELRKAVLSVIENPAPTIASADQSAVLAALKKEGLIAAGRTSVFPKFSDTTRSHAAHLERAGLRLRQPPCLSGRPLHPRRPQRRLRRIPRRRLRQHRRPQARLRPRRRR